MKNLLETFLKTLVEVAEKSEAEISNVVSNSIKDLEKGAKLTKETLSKIFEEAKSTFIKITGECTKMISEERSRLISGFNELEQALTNMETRVSNMTSKAEKSLDDISSGIKNKAEGAEEEINSALHKITKDTQKLVDDAKASIASLATTISNTTSTIARDAKDLTKTLFAEIEIEIKRAISAGEHLVEKIKNAAASALAIVENRLSEVEQKIIRMSERIELALSSAKVTLKNDVTTVITDAKSGMGDVEKSASALAGPAIFIEAFKRRGPELALFAFVSLFSLFILYISIVKPVVNTKTSTAYIKNNSKK